MPVALNGGQLTWTVTRQAFAIGVIVVFTVNWVSPGWAAVRPLAKTVADEEVGILQHGFMILASCLINCSYKIPDARPR